jgi:hypothetical protein
MQSFPAVLRIAQSVTTLAGAQDSLASINTTLFSPLAIVAVIANNSLYILHKDSTATADGSNVVAPAQGGPGRWFKYSGGATYLQAVSVDHGDIAPHSISSSSVSVPGAVGNSTQIVVFNPLDSGGGDGSIVVNPQITGLGLVTFGFANITDDVIPAGTVALEVALLGG